MKIGVVLPTYNDGNKWYHMVHRFADSLCNIANVDNLKFLVNYQNIDLTATDDFETISYLEDTIFKTNPTWKLSGMVKSTDHPYEKPISMVRVRNDCMMLDPDCDIYLFVDDDMKFNKGAGDCYNEIINFFEEDSRLGLVMSAGFLGGYNYKHQIKPAIEKHWTVCRGLFLRNLHTCTRSPIYPEESLVNHQCGYEEMIAAFEYIRRGYTLATHFNNPTTHKITTMDTGKDANKDQRYQDDQIHKVQESFASATRILAQEYGINLEIKEAYDFQRALTMIYNKYH